MSSSTTDLIWSFTLSLAIALLSVAFSHYIASRMKFSSTLKGLVTELNYNLHTLSEIKKFLEMEEDAEKEGKQALVTFPKPHRYAFNYFVIEGHLLKLPEKHRLELLEVYRGLDLISMYLDHYIETKYGILFVTTGAPQIRKNIRTILLKHLIPAIESHIRELLNILTPCTPRSVERGGNLHSGQAG